MNTKGNFNTIRNQLKERLDRQKKEKEEVSSAFKHSGRSTKYYQSKHWKQLRNWYIDEHPICENCLKYGRANQAVHVHHKTPFLLGATDDDRWALLLDENNLMALCEPCHKEMHRLANIKHLTYIDQCEPDIYKKI